MSDATSGIFSSSGLHGVELGASDFGLDFAGYFGTRQERSANEGVSLVLVVENPVELDLVLVWREVAQLDTEALALGYFVLFSAVFDYCVH